MHASPILKDEVTDVTVKARGSDPRGPWANEDAVARIKVLWVDHSATQIAGVLWDEFHLQVSRNSVVGKLHRMKLTINDKTAVHPKTKPERGQQRARISRMSREHSPSPLRTYPFQRLNISKEEIVLRCVEIEPRHLGLQDLTDATCKYPYADGPFTFCGHLTAPGFPYCADHHALTRQEPRPRPAPRAKMPIDMADGITGRSVFA